MTEPVEDFIEALSAAQASLATARDLIIGARVHDEAFGRLFEAHAVRDAYHARLPDLAHDVDEARAVAAHFSAGLRGGHRIVPAPPPTIEPRRPADAS